MFNSLDIFFEFIGFGGVRVFFQENFHEANFTLHREDAVFLVDDGFAHVDVE